jgi:hypothetical protein
MSEPSKSNAPPTRDLTNKDFAERMRKRRGEVPPPVIETHDHGDGTSSYVNRTVQDYLPWVPPNDKITLSDLDELANWFTHRSYELDAVLLPTAVFVRLVHDMARVSAVTGAATHGRQTFMFQHAGGSTRIIMESSVNRPAFQWSSR